MDNFPGYGFEKVDSMFNVFFILFFIVFSIGDNLSSTSSSTYYYITFQVASGDRMEFLVPDNEYGMIVEGDVGKITFQGTRYKGFVREH